MWKKSFTTATIVMYKRYKKFKCRTICFDIKIVNTLLYDKSLKLMFEKMLKSVISKYFKIKYYFRYERERGGVSINHYKLQQFVSTK